MVRAVTPTARLIAPTSARPGVRSTFTAASAVMPPGWCARRTASTGGRTEATGSARAASQAGTMPAMTATATAIGTASAARPGEACRPSADDSGSAAAAPKMPAVRPIAASSPSTAVKSRGRVQPRQARTPSSRRRTRIAADAEFATNSTQTIRISVNSTRLFLSTAVRIATATPFFTQPSLSVSDGWPNFPAGRSIVVGDGEDPATMSTSRSVRTAICWATSLIRSRDTAFGPVTPATRTRITLIGSLLGRFWP